MINFSNFYTFSHLTFQASIIIYFLDLPVRGPKKFRGSGTFHSPSSEAFSQAPRAPWKLVNSYQKNPWEKFTLNTSHPLRFSPPFFPNKSFSPTFLRIQTWRFDNRIIHLSVTDPWSPLSKVQTAK